MPEPCKVFLSSTGADLQAWRDAAFEAIQLAGASCIRMEDFNADPRPPADLCAAEVLRASLLVGLIGFHYGGRVPPEKDRSFTRMEIETAQAHGIDCFLYVAPDGAVPAVSQTGADLDAQTAFRKTLLETVTVGRPEHWSDKYRLALRIQAAVFRRCRPEAPAIERYAAGLQVELREKAEAAAAAPPDRIDTALSEKAAVEAKLADIETAYAAAEATIAGLRRTIAQYGNDLGAERRARAEAALDEQDFDTADALLREIEEAGELEVLRVANAAFQRGQIAEEQVRWADAAAHYAKAARLAPDFDRLIKAGSLLWKAGRYNEAIRFDEDLVALAKREFGEEDPNTATALNNVAQSYHALGRHTEAEPLYRRALEIGAATIGTAHPNHATHLNNLAEVLRATGRHAEAEPLYHQALEIDAATIGTGHPGYAIHLSNLAALLRDMGRYAEAEPLYHQAVKIGAATIGTAHPDYAIHLNNLAEVLRAMGRQTEAEPLYRQALEIDAATIGTQHPEYAIHLNNLALLLQAMGRHGEAEPLYAKMMPILRAGLGDEHPNTKAGAANYARLLRAHFPDSPALAELEAAFGADIGR